MLITLPYGTSQVDVRLAEANVMAVATAPHEAAAAQDEDLEVSTSLDSPIGTPRLRDLARGKHTAVMLVSDYTRPTPSGRLVPHLLRELEAGGLHAAGVTVVFASGTHRPTTPEEMKAILGPELCSRVATVSHDCDSPNMVYSGETSINRTPVWVNRLVAEADLRISVSGVEPHHCAGWSGGAKNLLPGVCSRKTVMTHHSLANSPGVSIGALDGNPFRGDLEEGTAMVGLDFILNVILTGTKRVSSALAGHWIEAHRAAVRTAEEMITCVLPEPADIVLASVGGAPRDSNFWQTEGKGLTRIRSAVKDRGVIVMVAECSEGVGHPELATALLSGSVGEIRERFKGAEFTVPGNKAYRVASQLERADIFLVTTGLTQADTGKLPVRLFSTVGAALDTAFAKMGPSARVAVVPRTTAVLLRVGVGAPSPVQAEVVG